MDAEVAVQFHFLVAGNVNRQISFHNNHLVAEVTHHKTALVFGKTSMPACGNHVGNRPSDVGRLSRMQRLCGMNPSGIRLPFSRPCEKMYSPHRCLPNRHELEFCHEEVDKDLYSPSTRE